MEGVSSIFTQPDRELVSRFFGAQSRWGFSDDLWHFLRIGSAMEMSQLLLMWPVWALLKSKDGYGLSLNVDIGHGSIILRRVCVYGIACLFSATMLKLSRSLQLITVLYIHYCRIRGRSISSTFFCLFQLLYCLPISADCIFMVAPTTSDG